MPPCSRSGPLDIFQCGFARLLELYSLRTIVMRLGDCEWKGVQILGQGQDKSGWETKKINTKQPGMTATGTQPAAGFLGEIAYGAKGPKPTENEHKISCNHEHHDSSVIR